MKDKKMEKEIKNILCCSDVKNSNANVDEYSFGGRKFESAGLVLKNIALNDLIDKKVVKAHKNNYIYIHDLDNYAIGMHNCLYIDFKNLFENGFTTRNGDVRPPRSISTAMQQMAVIMQCQSQIQYGGCASLHADFDLAPFVKYSFAKHYKDGLKYLENKENIDYEIEFMLNNPTDYSIADSEYEAYSPNTYKYAMNMLEKEGKQAAQGLYHNLNTLESRAGSQLPFSSLNFGRDTSPEGRLITKWLLQASIDGIGKFHRTPIFPISIFQIKEGINKNPGDPNYDLKLLALESTSKRLYPNYVNGDWSNANENVDNPDTYMATMGCRSIVGSDRNGFGNVKVGRGNISPITIVLPKLGIKHGICKHKRKVPDLQGFWKELDKVLAICEKGLVDRYNYIAKQNPKSAPFMYKNGTAKGYDICINDVEEMTKHGTNAIGIIGLAETLEALFGKNQVDEGIREFGREIVERIYKYTLEASSRTGLNFSCYFSPAENCCYTIMKKLKKEYGIIPNVTENNYLTNSIHVPVWEKIDVFDKINIESEFTKYGTGGCITYVEFDSSVKNNLKALEKIVDYALDLDIPYLAINFPIDTCLNCGLSEEINDRCPRCGSDKIEHLARVTGYLSTDYRNFNKGKQQEVKMRFKHSTITNFEE